MFVFVILHYLAEEMTKECVEHLEKFLDMNRCKIVIVDNASSNGSGQRLKDYYKNKDYCDVLLNNENVGFARGNNVGYKFAKEKYKPKYMIIMNNDVLINDGYFLDKIEKIHSETDFDVLGPDILSSKLNRGAHQNPMYLKQLTIQQVNKLISEVTSKLKHPRINYAIDKIKCSIRVRTRLKNLKRKFGKAQEEIHMHRHINPILHGSCYIFSPKFINNENEAFDSRTFLYREEEILHLKCMKKKYTMIYDPHLSVLHLEDVSTESELKFREKSIRQELEKQKFINTHQLASLKVLLDVMKE